MGQLFSRETRENREEVTDKSFAAAIELVDFLKRNVDNEAMFRSNGRSPVHQKILNCLFRGDRTLRTYFCNEHVADCASALFIYLQCLKQPLIPDRVQQLIIAENPGVPEEMIAMDALGLLHQDLSGPHLDLLKSLFELFRKIGSNRHRSELTSPNLPVCLLPTFFSIQGPWTRKWRQVASTFQELIIRAPEFKSEQRGFSPQLCCLPRPRERPTHCYDGTLPLEPLPLIHIFEPRDGNYIEAL